MSLVLYGFPLSANTHRVRLLLSMLSIPYEERTVNLMTGEHHQPAFLALNPLAQVPVLVDGDRTLFDSQAILVYLAESRAAAQWWPGDAYERARVAQWLFVNANEINNGIGYARNHISFRIPGDPAIPLARAKAVLAVLDQRLSEHDWLELGRPTLADIACSTLVSVADEAGLDRGTWPAVQRWHQRLAALPGFVPMPRLKARQG
ncbi:glutathione S-transferase family protein [Ramlibacter sp.]|uniref:glutathione S-transferase family protein n=1 Tax=Ramlibacter sp. TaxID=1917967 RepID=UPI0017E47435|nr:glutathione S-transferase family protein [Ramlibacter sp.]MBA2674067.1 glutathione S-transferase family protein [Ramlibacter sp.]